MSLETDLSKIVSVFALAFFSFWPAIPAGLALGLAPAVVIATTTLSYVCGAALVLLPGERVRRIILARLERRVAQGPPGALRRAWARWGVMGLGLLGPMTVGAQVGAALGLALNAGARPLFGWMFLGALAWSVLLTLAVALGLQAVL